MPPLASQDDYERCLWNKKELSVYCTIITVIKPDKSSEVWNQIEAFSSKKKIHFAHDLISDGVCLSECERKLSHLSDEQRQNYLHTTFIVITILILGIVSAATGLDIKQNNQNSLDYYKNDRLDLPKKQQYLLCFSLMRNWYRLTAPPKTELGRDLRFVLTIRYLTTLLVVMGHIGIAYSYSPARNSQFIENSYYRFNEIFTNCGTTIVQTFFVASGVLLYISFSEILKEGKLNLKYFGIGIIYRYLRLTPPYAYVLLYHATYLFHSGSGTYWKFFAETEYSYLYEYYKMPPMYRQHNFEKCLWSKKEFSIYCTTVTVIKPDKTSEVWNQIEEFSSKKKIHFAHDIIGNGICLWECENELSSLTKEKRESLYVEEFPWRENRSFTYDITAYENSKLYNQKYGKTLNQCENLWLRKNYNLSGYTLINWCTTNKEYDHYETDYLHTTFIVITILILGIVSAATGLDIKQNNQNSLDYYKNDRLDLPKRQQYLLCFSLMRNWYRLTAPPKTELGRDLRFVLTIRYITTFLIVLGHIAIIYRYIRLTPPYAYILLYHATYLFHNGYGAYWKFFAETEYTYCEYSIRIKLQLIAIF
uniref:CSON006904 protein n=1 Tax=Culicoides sonorensis TaxID=179676 RepID=A0A336LWS6_CULSO